MNESIFRAINDIGINYPALDPVLAFLGNNFGYLMIFALLYFILSYDDKKRAMKELALILAVAVAAWLVAHIIKYFNYEPRPFLALDGVKQLLIQEADSSFPSGHATFYSALAMAMYFYHKRVAAVLAAGALIIGFGRIVAGVHFPFDVLAGFIIGPIVAYLTHLLAQKILAYRNLQNY